MINTLKKHNFIGNKKFYKTYIALAVPIILTNMIASSLHLVDNIMVGGLGDDAIAAVGACNEIFFIFILLMFALAASVQIFLSQFLGAKDEKNVKIMFNFGLIITFSVSSIAVIISNIFARKILGLYLADPEVIDLALQYFRIVSISFIFYAISVMLSGAFKAYAMPKVALVSGVMAVIINTVLNAILIYGLFGVPEMGVKGAAIATILARIAELFILIIILHFKNTPIKIAPSSVRYISKSLLKKFSLTATPLIANEIIWGVLQNILIIIYVARDDKYMVSLSIAKTVNALLTVFFGGVFTATSVMMGKTLGSGDFNKAKKSVNTFYFTAVAGGLFFSFISSFLILFVPKIYNNVSGDVMGDAMTLLRFYIVFFIFNLINATSFIILRAGGDIKSIMFVDILYTTVVVIPVALICRFVLNFDFLPTVFITLTVDALKLFIYIRLIKRGKWIRNLAH